MNYIDSQFTDFASTFEVLELVGLFFLVVIVSEAIWDVFSKQRRSLRETLANFAIAVGNDLLDRTVYGLVFILGLFIAEPFALFSMPADMVELGPGADCGRFNLLLDASLGARSANSVGVSQRSPFLSRIQSDDLAAPGMDRRSD